MKIMGGKKPDALFPLLGDSDSPLPLPTLYLKKIMTKLMLLCFWQHINIIMRSIRPRRCASFSSFIFIPFFLLEVKGYIRRYFTEE